MLYEVEFLRGDYKERQLAANAAGVVCYVEHHFNAAATADADYSLVIVGSNASEKSKEWGSWYSRECSRVFGTVDKGIVIGGYQGRGDGNLVHTAMPAILLEPLFGSTPRHADIIRSELGQLKLARLLTASVYCNFPDGGLVGFSVGHKYKKSNPNDRGAAVYGSPALSEADYAEKVLLLAADLLETNPGGT